MKTRFLQVTAATLLASVAGLGISAAPAWAHNSEVSSSPASDESVASAPSQFSVTFNEPVIATGTMIDVVDANGVNMDNGDVQVSGPTVTQPLQPNLPAGTYTVNWRVTSEDGHPVAKTQSFTVQATAPAATPLETATVAADAATDATSDATSDATVNATATAESSAVAGAESTANPAASGSPVTSASAAPSSEAVTTSPASTEASDADESKSSIATISVVGGIFLAAVGIGLAWTLLRAKRNPSSSS